MSAVADDGVWAVVDMPSGAAVCGSEDADCGYVSLTLTSAPVGGALGATLVCPPFCPGAVHAGVVPIASSHGGFALGTDPSAPHGSLPVQLPSTDYGYTSEGVYCAVACAKTGLFTDPSTGACTNASDPASFACAYGSGGGCITCPSGALCPGGTRLWPRVGFWAPSDAVSAVLPCEAPYPELKCGGWNVTRGAVQCGARYKTGSPLCGACAPGHYLPGDGTCVPCPVVASAWDRYRGIIYLLCGVLAASTCVGALLVALVKWNGGTLDGSAMLLAGLVQWSVAALQTVAQAAPASAASLPAFLSTLFRGIAVLQLDGVLLPPACTGSYAFESQVRQADDGASRCKSRRG